MTVVLATILLFVVMDAFGNLPLFFSALDVVIERLMGLLLTAVAVEMLLGGIRMAL